METQRHVGKKRRKKKKTRKKENYYVVQQKYEGLTSMREGLGVSWVP